jgi:flagellar biosynthesis protein FlhB
MPETRPFPASPRRLALARQAGVHGASPLVVAAAAWVAVAVVIAAVGASLARALGAMVTAACRGDSAAVDASSLISSVVAAATPVLGAAAVAAVVAHLVQTRALWLPRRRLAGAPAPARSRGAHAAVELGGAVAIGAIAAGWLWLVTSRLAALFEVEPASGGSALASIVATTAIGLVGIAAVDAMVRRFELAAGLRMTAAERREDLRQAGLDPRWRASRRDELAHATVLILGDGVAAAIAWDPIHRPVPVRVAAGRGPEATRLVGLARRDRVPVHREPILARELADATTIAEATWPRLAEIVAAVRRE